MAPDTAAIDGTSSTYENAVISSDSTLKQHEDANVTINAVLDAPISQAPISEITPTTARVSADNIAPSKDAPVAPEKFSQDSTSQGSPENHTKSTPEKTANTPDLAPEKESSTIANFFTKVELERIIARVINGEERELGILGVVLGLAVVRYCLPRLNWGTVIVGVLGMGFGGFIAAFYLLAVPEDTRLRRARTIAHFGKHHDRQLDIVDGLPAWSNKVEKEGESSKGIHLSEVKDVAHQRISIAPDIDPMVEEMISFTLRDFVNVPVGLVSEGLHNIHLRASLVAMAMNVSNRLTNMRLPETALLGVFGLQNSFIVHLRAYRELRATRLPIADYVKTHANADSVLGRCYHQDERLKQFRSTARAICQALLSKNDQQSVALFAVMQEIMATHVLESTLEHVCDPDFINLSIIDYFTAPVQDSKPDLPLTGVEAAKTSSPGSKTQEAPITSLADSILLNAANLMDKSALEKQGSDLGMQTPVRTSTPQRRSLSSEVSAVEEVSAFNHPAGAATDARKPPPVITLKQVLANKNEHVDVFQEFMAYLQVWDAMDLAQFWLMIDIFHRQIEQGTLSNIENLKREAYCIYDTYCGPNPDHDIAGIKEAKGGALLKNLKSHMQRDPATCLLESQEWALGVLETQYWVPFKIKQDHGKPAKNAQGISQRQQPASPQSLKSARSQDSSLQDTKRQGEHSSSPSSSSLTASLKPSTPPPATAIMASPVSPPRQKVQSIDVSDMVHRRPKTLMSNVDLSYMIEVQTESGQGWMVTRTFQQLEQLQVALVQQYPVVQRTLFPRWRLQPSDKVCSGLKSFLRSMLTIPEVSESASLAWFLSKEYDQNPQAIMPGATPPVNATAGLISAFAPISDGGAAIGTAAAQGAKTALRQASEASMSAGRFFKSLGAAVTTGGSSPQLLAEDRSVRGSFESERSIRSVSSALTLSEQRPPNGVSLPNRLQDIDQEGLSRASFSSDSTQVNKQTSLGSISGKVIESTLDSPASSLQSQVLDGSPALVLTPLHHRPQTPHHGPSLIDTSRPNVSDEGHTRSADATLPTPGTSTGPTLVSEPSATLESQAGVSSGVATSVEPKKPQMSLLSNDELDLLIETTFTVLEDMMDFSKSQSIRRMTFGMLRELVRKSYRVAINQSFSAWVEQTTSHEKAVATVRWMKDDLFWPNGEWPVAPVVDTPAAAATPTANEVAAGTTAGSVSSPSEKRDVFQVGEDLYEVGSDGIAVKVTSTDSIRTPTPVAVTTAPAMAAGIRTQQEKDATRDKARELVKMMIPGSLATVLGREAVLRGIVDVFDMFQIKELNLGLALSAMEMTVRLVFTR